MHITHPSKALLASLALLAMAGTFAVPYRQQAEAQAGEGTGVEQVNSLMNDFMGRVAQKRNESQAQLDTIDQIMDGEAQEEVVRGILVAQAQDAFRETREQQSLDRIANQSALNALQNRPQPSAPAPQAPSAAPTTTPAAPAPAPQDTDVPADSRQPDALLEDLLSATHNDAYAEFMRQETARQQMLRTQPQAPSASSAPSDDFWPSAPVAPTPDPLSIPVVQQPTTVPTAPAVRPAAPTQAPSSIPSTTVTPDVRVQPTMPSVPSDTTPSVPQPRVETEPSAPTQPADTRIVVADDPTPTTSGAQDNVPALFVSEPGTASGASEITDDSQGGLFAWFLRLFGF